MKSISIFLNKEGYAATPKDEGIIRVYAYDHINNSWDITKEFEFSLLKSTSIVHLRNTISNMIQRIGDCRIFVAREVVGQLFSVLEANRFNIYEAEGKPEQFLESILASENKEIKKPDEISEQNIITYPKETDISGNYFIDLKAALSSAPDLSSKKVLLPFLTNRSFRVLEVICDHVPKWFDDELKRQGLNSDVSKLDENSYKVVISVQQSL
jgi:Fe-only nitrogenase accessory protein AnfO